MADGIKRLYEILAETTQQFRKGEVLQGTPELVGAVQAAGPDVDLSKLPGGVLEVYAMPHEREAGANITPVDLVFITVGVNAHKAAQYRGELAALIPQVVPLEILAGGPSYIHVGAEIGDQGAAFQLFALGQVLGFWKIITPALFGATGAEALSMAGAGFIMIDGFRPAPTVGGE